MFVSGKVWNLIHPHLSNNRNCDYFLSVGIKYNTKKFITLTHPIQSNELDPFIYKSWFKFKDMVKVIGHHENPYFQWNQLIILGVSRLTQLDPKLKKSKEKSAFWVNWGVSRYVGWQMQVGMG